MLVPIELSWSAHEVATAYGFELLIACGALAFLALYRAATRATEDARPHEDRRCSGT